MANAPETKFYIATYGGMGLDVAFYSDPLAYGREIQKAKREHESDKLDSYTYGDIPSPADKKYLKALETAVLEAEWWLADPQVSARKDPRGERKRTVYKAADLIRERGRTTDTHAPIPSFIASLTAIKDLLEEGTDKETEPGVYLTPAEQAIDLINALIITART
ncbi:hypothetical protein A6U87_27480 [Rhizobium sp. AC44/96]|nr:hypothetical protein A6U87_27480 [Rhizobium sp. AC44/96]